MSGAGGDWAYKKFKNGFALVGEDWWESYPGETIISLYLVNNGGEVIDIPYNKKLTTGIWRSGEYSQKEIRRKYLKIFNAYYKRLSKKYNKNFNKNKRTFGGMF
jgi:hypothetical protein